MSKGGGEFAVLPGGVRADEIQEPALLPRGLLHEQRVGAAGEFKNADAVLQIGLVGVLVLLNSAEQGVLLGSPLRRLLVEEIGPDPPVELVHVHGVDAVLEPGVFGLEPRDRLVVELLLVAVALPQGFPDPRQTSSSKLRAFSNSANRSSRTSSRV
jgi:hypothetical protein